VLTHGDAGSTQADVVTQNGKITRVGYVSESDMPAGARVIDATNRYVMPGGIDTHTHLEMPFMGTVTVDDYHYGTTAAVAGGTTLLMDFIIPGADQSLVEAYRNWESKAVPKINCDIAFHMAVTYYSEAMMEEMATLTNELGVTSYVVPPKPPPPPSPKQPTTLNLSCGECMCLLITGIPTPRTLSHAQHFTRPA